MKNVTYSLPSGRHILTVCRIEAAEVAAVVQECSRNHSRIDATTLKFRIENIGMEPMDLVKVAEQNVRLVPSLCQVGHAEFVSVIDQHLNKRMKIKCWHVIGIGRIIVPTCSRSAE